jgi:Xaa-Pro aminopeptidase
MSSPFERRTRRLQTRLRAGPGDAVVCFPSPNLYYLTGFWEEPMERALYCFVPATGEPALVAPALYREQLADETWIRDVRTYADGTDPADLVAATAADLGIADGTLRLDPTMWTRFSQSLRDTLPDASFDLATDTMAALRARKDGAELDALERAAAVADTVAADVRSLGDDVVGMTETTLAHDIERRLIDAGGDRLAFDVIVAAGANGAKPHYRHGDREIRAGDPVVLDFGARVDHYPSDQTRTVVFAGDPPAGYADAHRAVQDAQQAAIDAVTPGVTAESVDAAARDLLEDRGYGDAFVHRTGHGVGLDVHEDPYIVEGNDTELEPGMVFSVEPGVYLEGAFGVRIEDLVVVTDEGCRRLNDTPRGWRA